METPDNNNIGQNQSVETVSKERKRRRDQFFGDPQNNPASSRVFTGLFIIGLGAFFLARQMGVDFPHWLFQWPMILIAVGIFIGARHGFRTGGWVIPIVIGCVFMMDYISPGFSFHEYIWPVLIMGFGLFILLRPRKKDRENSSRDWNAMGGSTNHGSTEDYIDSVSVFGGTKKNIISKDFKGGDIVIFFGGTEFNLTQADITAPVELEVTQFFGGTKLIVPSNWKIVSEVVTVFGSFEDKRQILKDIPEGNKVLILRGTVVFGGIDVKSY